MRRDSSAVDGIRTEKVGGIWHGYLEGHPEIDERALTEEIARRKVEAVAKRMARNDPRFGILPLSARPKRRWGKSFRQTE